MLFRSWAEGMASSLRTGVAALRQFSRSLDAALLALCDQPGFSADAIAQIVAAQRATGRSIVAARYAGRHGAPALFLRQHFDALAHLTGEAGRLPQPTAAQKLVRGYLGEHRSWPTAMDFAADGSAAAVLTYGHLLLFPRRAGEPWAATLAREPVILPAHNLPQAEAMCFSADGRAILVASEKFRSLLRYELR